MRCFIFIFQTNNRIMIRINTMPLGMQNLLSGNRKLYKQGTCIEHISNGNRRLMIMDENDMNTIEPIDAPYVISNEDGSLVKYSDNMVKIELSNSTEPSLNISLIDSCNGNESVLKEIPLSLDEQNSSYEQLMLNIEPYNSSVSNTILISADTLLSGIYAYDKDNEKITFTDSNYRINDGKAFKLTHLITDFPNIKKIVLIW